MPFAGRIDDVMKAASGLPNLEVLNLAGQAFSGTLPTQYQFPKLLDLNLMDNKIVVYSQSQKPHASVPSAPAMNKLRQAACEALAVCCVLALLHLGSSTLCLASDGSCKCLWALTWHASVAHVCLRMCLCMVYGSLGQAADADTQVLHSRLCCLSIVTQPVHGPILLYGLQGTIPAEWGEDTLFPALVNLTLSYNEALSGNLPASWGADNSSLTSLRLFQANNCNLTGPLPANWSMNLPALKDVNISSNALTGLCR